MSEFDNEAARLNKLGAWGALNHVTIKHLMGSIKDRLRNPCYVPAAQSSDRRAIINAQNQRAARIRRYDGGINA